MDNDYLKMMLIMQGVPLAASGLKAVYQKLNPPQPQPVQPQQIQLVPDDGMTPMTNGMRFPRGGYR